MGELREEHVWDGVHHFVRKGLDNRGDVSFEVVRKSDGHVVFRSPKEAISTSSAQKRDRRPVPRGQSGPAGFQTLETFASLISALGWLVVGVVVIGFLASFEKIEEQPTVLLAFGGALLLALSLVAFGKLLRAIRSIEANTRRIMEIVEKSGGRS